MGFGPAQLDGITAVGGMPMVTIGVALSRTGTALTTGEYVYLLALFTTEDPYLVITRTSVVPTLCAGTPTVKTDAETTLIELPGVVPKSTRRTSTKLDPMTRIR
ncbi:MAG: hypothetical protein WCF25_11470 [Acidimicrobiales bacterium]